VPAHEKFFAAASSGLHRYSTEEFLEKEAREKLFHLGSANRILDFGCGTADLTVYYARSFTEVIAVDASEQMLARARERAARFGVENIRFLHADDHTLWPQLGGLQFDVITTAAVLQFLAPAEIAAFNRDAAAHVYPSGRIVHFDISDPRIYLLVRLGAFGQKPWTLAQLPRFVGATARFAGRKLVDALVGRPTDVMGYQHHPSVLQAAAEQCGLEAEFVSSMYYEYRYHVINRRATRVTR
jgi:cyclopropane-fatty-acyl-phospholipid synthase